MINRRFFLSGMIALPICTTATRTWATPTETRAKLHDAFTRAFELEPAENVEWISGVSQGAACTHAVDKEEDGIKDFCGNSEEQR